MCVCVCVCVCVKSVGAIKTTSSPNKHNERTITSSPVTLDDQLKYVQECKEFQSVGAHRLHFHTGTLLVYEHT